MYDIITFGSATWDIFMEFKNLKTVKNQKFITGRGICFNLGSKIDADNIRFSSGGGGTNTAVTFANQGFKTAYCGMVGDDLAGEKVIEELAKFGVNVRYISKTRIKPTNHSVILNPEKEDRTILVYRGASELLHKRDIPFSKLKAKWFYLAPFSGLLSELTDDLIDFAHKKKIKVALNPGNSQLSLNSRKYKKILKKVDILFLNQEEASLLTKISINKEKNIFKKIDALCPGIAIMTKGGAGVVVSDGKHLYRAKAPEARVVDQTGAGDSFGAGFVSGFIKSNGDIKSSIELASANAGSCLSGWGAKTNLLTKSEKFKKIKVGKELCSENSFCQIKKLWK